MEVLQFVYDFSLLLLSPHYMGLSFYFSKSLSSSHSRLRASNNWCTRPHKQFGGQEPDPITYSSLGYTKSQPHPPKKEKKNSHTATHTHIRERDEEEGKLDGHKGGKRIII